MAILSFLKLEDFVSEIIAEDPIVWPIIRIEGISRTVPSKQPGGDLVEWYVLVTTRRFCEIIMFSIRVGRCLAIFAKNESYHVLNVKKAENLLKAHLKGKGFEIRPGTWEPSAVMENLSAGSAGLWHFEDKMLTVNVDEEDG